MNFSRRSFLGLCAAAAASAQDSKRPNIVLILADDLGYECLGSYGGTSYRTPHLDELAHTGVRFQHAYAQPLCTPTRLQFMTGLYNFRNWKAFGIMDPKERTFGHLFRDAGYKTCIAGKWQMYSYNPPDYQPEWRAKGQRIEDSGFDEHCIWHAEHTEDKGSRYADPTVYRNGKLHKNLKGQYGEDIFAEFITNFMSAHRSEPFFVYYPMALTHDPFVPSPASPQWGEGDRLKSHPRHFKSMVEYMDTLVGRIVKKIDDLGLRERTLIVFFSDNGTHQSISSMLGDRKIQGGKGLPTDAGTRVPLIVNWKGTAAAGRVTDALVDSTDFLPTAAEAAGIPMPKNLDGRSFLTQIRGEGREGREWVLVHHDPRPGWDKDRFRLDRFVRDTEYKLYSDGRLYHIPSDPLERNPVTKVDGTADNARRKLQAVLDRVGPTG